MKVWYVLKGGLVDFLGMELFLGNMFLELCFMILLMNFWSRNIIWLYVVICFSIDRK